MAVPRPLWQTFTYLLPARLDCGDPEGCRVAVEFGSSRLVGFVWSESHNPASTSLKQVLDRLDPAPLLPPVVWRMVKWAARYYISPPGLAASAAFPPGLSGRAVQMAMLEKRGAPPDIARMIEPGRPMSFDRLQALLSSKGRSGMVGDLLASGALISWWQPDASPRGSDPGWIEAGAESEVLVREAARRRSRASAQASLLALLAACGRMPRREALARSGASAQALRTLVAEGLLTSSPGGAPAAEGMPVLPSMGGLGGSLEALPPTPAQKAAVEAISESAPGRTFLLHGVTGSGKTEVYLQAIARVLERGRTALVLVPEISLTPQLVERFSSRFPGEVAVLHSGLAASDRLSFWSAARSGSRRIAIGARSAVFAPLSEVGLIVVDEENDGGFKQSEHPRYNARDLAILRGAYEGAAVVLGSASPSLESWVNASSGRYDLLELPGRLDGRSLPVAEMIPMRTGPAALDACMVSAIGEALAARSQVIVMINRRGFSPSQVCRACGRREECPDCGIPLTYHRKGEVLRCHWCGHWKPAPARCPDCGGASFSREGPGVQKVESELKRAFPEARIIRMDSDTVNTAAAHWEAVGRFAGGGADILLGTQMVAKGHDFPGVTLVCILSADMSLALPDFRAAERTFSLVLQAVGRAGRGSAPGIALVQASAPRDEVLVAAAAGDFRNFAASECDMRRTLGFPPFTYAARLLWSGGEASRVEQVAKAILSHPHGEGVRILGPSPAVMPRIAGRWRWNALALSASRAGLHSFLEELVPGPALPPGVRFDVDVDPQDLL